MSVFWNPRQGCCIGESDEKRKPHGSPVIFGAAKCDRSVLMSQHGRWRRIASWRPQAAFADVSKVAETSRVLVWSTSARTLMAEAIKTCTRMHQFSIRAPPHGRESPKAETIPIRG